MNAGDEQKRIKPVVIIKTGIMDDNHIGMLRENGLCVVECEGPDQVQFMEPPPVGYDRCDAAAIQLFRSLMSRNYFSISRNEFATMFADILVKGSDLKLIKRVKNK